MPVNRVTIRRTRMKWSRNIPAVMKGALATTIPLIVHWNGNFFPMYLATKRSIGYLSSFLVRERWSRFLSRRTVYKGCHSTPPPAIQVCCLEHVPCCNRIFACRHHVLESAWARQDFHYQSGDKASSCLSVRLLSPYMNKMATTILIHANLAPPCKPGKVKQMSDILS